MEHQPVRSSWRSDALDLLEASEQPNHADYHKAFVFCDNAEEKGPVKYALDQFVIRAYRGRWAIVDGFSHYLFMSRENEPVDRFALRVFFEGNRPRAMQCNGAVRQSLETNPQLLELMFRWNIKCVVHEDPEDEEAYAGVLDARTRAVADRFQVTEEELLSSNLYLVYMNQLSEADGKVPSRLYKSHGCRVIDRFIV